jgi:hypothetical protein
VLPADFGDKSTRVYKEYIDFFFVYTDFFFGLQTLATRALECSRRYDMYPPPRMTHVSSSDFGNKSARVYTEHIDFGSTGKAFLKSIKCVRA